MAEYYHVGFLEGILYLPPHLWSPIFKRQKGEQLLHNTAHEQQVLLIMQVIFILPNFQHFHSL